MGRRVFVGNLSWEAAWQDVKDHMRGPNGDLGVLHAEVMMDGSGRSKGCALVEYASPQVTSRRCEWVFAISLLVRLAIQM